jgi:hypothetical protein
MIEFSASFLMFHCQDHRDTKDRYWGYRKFANRNFANWTFAIGKFPVNSRQYTPSTFANW